MTDKVQKIREEVERLKSNLMYGACSSQIAMETRCKEEAYNEVLAILDTMQEEPASKDLEGEVAAFLDQYTYPREEVDFSSFARHIAQWQKQQMMKEVIVGRFTFNPNYPDNDHIVIDKDELPKYKLGDKVKLIVIKED